MQWCVIFNLGKGGDMGTRHDQRLFMNFRELPYHFTFVLLIHFHYCDDLYRKYLKYPPTA